MRRINFPRAIVTHSISAVRPSFFYGLRFYNSLPSNPLQYLMLLAEKQHEEWSAHGVCPIEFMRRFSAENYFDKYNKPIYRDRDNGLTEASVDSMLQ